MLFKSFILFVCLFTSLTVVQAREENCRKYNIADAKTHMNDWLIYKDIASLETDFNKLYIDGRRLPERVYKKENQYFLPTSEGEESMPAEIIQAITNHIEQALENGYSEYVFYPDMGHVHILVPEDADIVKPALQRKDIKFLYHTAELFQFKKGSLLDGELIGDTWLQWRYYSRNFVGELEEDKNLKVVFAKDSPYNTVRGLEGYRQVETLYMSSSEKGCFSYNHSGERMFFDISRLK